VVKRKSRSPEEILSFFDGVEHPKIDYNRPSTDTSSTFVATQEKDDTQETHQVPEPERPDYTAPQRPPGPPRASPTLKPRAPSWMRAKGVSSKQTEGATAARPMPYQATSQQTRQQVRDRLLTSNLHVNTARHKSMILLLPILCFILILAVYQSSFIPTVNWPGTDKLVVKSIVYKPDDASAIVDNQLVREGDEISGATVLKINKDAVEFEVRSWWSGKPHRLKRGVRR